MTSLYLHIPFCGIRCHYCDFNTFTGQGHRQQQYVDALIAEIRGWGRARDWPATPTIFFGGGTPSLLSADQVRAILDACRASFRVLADAEVTLEANPGTVDRASLTALREAGVNRLSFGVQVFDDELLQAIGRDHDVAAAHRAIDDARAAGFDNLNIDLIYGLPGQDLANWRATLRAAVATDPDHISTYGMTIEPNTRFGKDEAAGRISAVDPDLAADMVEAADAILGGYERYEIANFSKPGRACRHNLVYWHNEPFLGLGAGAHSSTIVARFADHRPLGRYINGAAGWTGPTLDGDIPEASGPIDWVEPLDHATQLGETMMLALRLREGIKLGAFRERWGVDPCDLWRGPIDELTSFGLLENADGSLRLTDRGRLLGDEVFVRFVA